MGADSEESPPSPAIEGDRAQRIVDAMRASVARRGVAGSTFDRVARDAGVSRGLLHYHFGTKERLLAEVARRDGAVRLAALEQRLAAATCADEVVAALVQGLDELLREDPDGAMLAFELATLARRNEEVAAELREILRLTRRRVAAALAAKDAEGVVRLRADPDAVADVLLSLGDGLALRMLADDGHPWGATARTGTLAARALLQDGRGA